MTPKEREAMQQALEALQEYRDTQMIKAPRRAITDLREALDHSGEANEMVEFFSKEMKNKISVARAEQAEQEPVYKLEVREFRDGFFGKTKSLGHNLTPLIKTGRGLAVGVYKLYAAPVRTKDLTDKQIEKVWNKNGGFMGMPIDFARSVIAKDREKNK